MEVRGARGGGGGLRGECASSGPRTVGMCKPANHIYTGPCGWGDGQSFSRSSSRIKHRELTLDEGLVGTGMWEIIYLQPRAPETPVSRTKASCAWRMWETVCLAPGPPVRGSHTRARPWEGSGRGQASSRRAPVSETTCCFFKDLGPFVFPFTFPLSFVITAGRSSRENSLEPSPEDTVTGGHSTGVTDNRRQVGP